MKIELKILNKDFYSSMTDGRYVEVRVDNLPEYATQGSAGVDLRATYDVVIYPGETVAIPTGIAIHIGSSHSAAMMGMIVPRSGKGSNEGLVLANLVGILDDDYQGEIIIQAWNRNKKVLPYYYHNHLLDQQIATAKIEDDKNTIKIKAGDRIAQLVFVPVVKAQWQIVEEFTHMTERGTGGFGSTD